MKRFLKYIHFGTVLGALVAIYIFVYLVQTVHHNYQLQKQIAELQADISEVENEKESLKYKIQYYQSEAYKEKEARAKLGLQQPGESVVILPHEKENQDDEQENSKQVQRKSN